MSIESSSALLDSFHFDDNGKTIDQLYDHFGLLGENENEMKSTSPDTKRVKTEYIDDNGKVQTFLGWVVSYDPLSGLYTVQYDNNGGFEEIPEEDIGKIVID